jgi:hypothetical protein
MTLAQPNPSVNRGLSSRYLRPPAPLHFPEQEDVSESTDHKLRVIALWQSVMQALGDGALVGSDLFLYWDPTDPKKCLAPDLAVRTGTPSAILKTWKTWERGAPHVGVEIVSDSDRSAEPFARKLERYRQAGIAEVVRFDVEDADRPLRLWDLLDGDLVERAVTVPDARFCDALGLYWCVVGDPVLGSTLRLGRDPAGAELLPTPGEMRDAALVARDAALARVGELEAELARRR